MKIKIKNGKLKIESHGWQGAESPIFLFCNDSVLGLLWLNIWFTCMVLKHGAIMFIKSW